ncbi:MAG: NAD(P)H-hydrate dehydratase [Cyclobacteriaceae bacterium]|nr:NAD(P)H-hydrate dehydratase [Cyclobacteriaceae bacterium]
MKVLLTSQIREADAYTIQNEPVSSINLMERASLAFVKWLQKNINLNTEVHIFCGGGNNGGDGLAIARLLHEEGCEVQAFVLSANMKPSEDFSTNLHRLKSLIKVVTIEDENGFPVNIQTGHIIIDALFGSGLSRPLEGLNAKLIEHLNHFPGVKISVDIPSGMYGDKFSDGIRFRADHTVAFQVPKLAFFMPENARYTGHWHLVDIGLDAGHLQQVHSPYHILDREMLLSRILPRERFSHKGHYGHGLILAGSKGKMGAVVLAARAALRSGAGLLTCHVPVCGYPIVQTAVPEAMASEDDNIEYTVALPDISIYTAIAAGPGWGQHKETAQVLQNLLSQARQPLVLDADALNLLSQHSAFIELIPENTILTPHPGEFRRMAGDWDNDFHRLEKLRTFAIQHRCIVVLKGAFTSIALPDGNVFFNPTGNPGMATGGSGDVLTGIILSLLGQYYLPSDAAKLGVFLHGLAGDLAASRLGYTSLIASDIIENLPAAFQSFERA